MKKMIVGAALLAAGVFGVGYAAGQIGGVGGIASAATTTTTPTATQPSHPGDCHHGGAPAGPHADGTVTAINGDTLTISAGNDPAGSNEYTKVTTVQLTGNTRYDAGPNGTASKSSIKVGSYIVVDGTVSSDGKTITASRVGIVPGGPIAGR